MRTLLGQWGACLGVWPYTDTVTDTSLNPGAGPVCKQIDPALIVWVMVSGGRSWWQKIRQCCLAVSNKEAETESL